MTIQSAGEAEKVVMELRALIAKLTEKGYSDFQIICKIEETLDEIEKTAKSGWY